MNSPRSLTRAAPLMAAAVLAALWLAACAQPAGIVIALDASTALLIRGGETQVEITLTRQGGAAAAVSLELEGAPANVTASFAPVVLSGGILTSTLTLTAAAGAANGDYPLNVTATGTGLTADAALALEVSGLTVTGKVIGVLEAPSPGLGVESQGVTTLTNALGEFTLANLSVPYDLVIWESASETSHVYQGLQSATPLLSPAFISGGSLTPYTAGVGGTLSGGVIPVEADQVVAVCVEGLDGTAFGCNWVNPGDSVYSINATWLDQADRQVRLHALQIQMDGDGLPVSYLGYGTASASLSDGVAEVVDIAMGAAPASAEVTVETAGPVSGVLAAVQITPNLTMVVAQPASTSFTLPMPVLPGATYAFVAAGPSNLSYVWESGVTGGAVSLLLPVAPLQVSPPDGATGVTHDTDFSTLSSSAGPTTFLWFVDSTGPSFALTTMASTATIPDLSSTLAGYSLPAGADYSWMVIGHEGETIEASTKLLAEVYYFLALNSVGGSPGSIGSSSLAQSESRGFTTAP